MKQTLLEMTQDILSSMDSDEVNSISDTVEALQVAKVIRTAYFDLITRADLPEVFEPFVLATATTYGPTALQIPSGYVNVQWVKYNTETTDDTDDVYTLMEYLPHAEFLARMHSLVESDDNVDITTVNSVKYYYKTDAAPTCYTSLDDTVLIFDSYDSDVEANLQASKSLAYGRKIPTWSYTDSFTPELDADQFPLLYNEAKSLAWAELKQAQHPKAEISAKRLWTRLQRTKEAVAGDTALDKLPNYGRK